MSQHLTVISYQRQMNLFLEKVALTVRPQGEHRIIRCQDPLDLPGLVRQAGGQETLLLDLVGHGGEEENFKMGDAILLENGKQPPSMFTDLGGILPRAAEVRLLGCYTGRLVQTASAALNGRDVSGTPELLWADDFDEKGLSQRCALITTKKLSNGSFHRITEFQVAEEDQEAARRWQRLLPEGYRLARRGDPLVLADARHVVGDARITVALARRLVLIEDDPQRPPLVLEWSRAASPPPLQGLLSALPTRG
jgi:hypothetical protein